MLGLLSQPKPQSAETAIATLCDRISNSLLIEDRKAAVLALRGLAHENRELVASLGLQGFFDVIIKDHDDLEATKATLETLLILFNTDTRRKVRNRRYISPLLRVNMANSEAEPTNSTANDISLWLTDRLLHDEEALQCILHLTTTKNDAFTAVYALQLVSVMLANRPVEAKQVILMSGGVGPLVTALGSVQDMVRDEALLVLAALTSDNLELQKLVTFEGGFDKTFDILRDGGGVVFGGRFAEDCLTLLANLIEYNTSNQKLFTQSGYVSQWTALLQSIVDAQNEEVTLRDQAIANIEAALNIGQLLCVPGAGNTKEHQDILCSSGALTLVLQIAFSFNSPPAVRVSSLITTASLINNNDTHQTELLAMDVPYYDLTIRKVTLVEPRTIPVSQALLNWAVNLNAIHLFDLRAASLVCLSSAFSGNNVAKSTFVTEQVEKYHKRSSIESSYSSSSDENTNSLHGTPDANIVEALAEYSDESRLNPYRIWFAAAIVMRLFINAPEIKQQLQQVSVGDETLGMEVHSLIQAITGEMQGSLQQKDPTIALGYLQLLCVWVYDDIDAVNEFTRETSAIQALLAHQVSDPLVESLDIILLGIAYTFCSKNSALPRQDFHRLLTQTLGRDQYMLLIRKFRHSSTFQNFEESDMFRAPRNSSGSPSVYLDGAFVGLMRETIGHISRAIDANPDIEPSAKLTIEMHDEVKADLHLKSEALGAAEAALANLQKDYEASKKKLEDATTLSSEREALLNKRNEEFSQVETSLKDLESANGKLKETVTKLETDLKSKTEALATLESDYQKLKTDFESRKGLQQKAEEGVNNLTRELFQLQRAKESAEKENSKLKSEVAKLNPKLESALKSQEDLKTKYEKLQADSKSLSQTKEVNDKLVAKLKETAAVLKQSEEEEQQLRQELSKAKLEAESHENELRSLKNREAAARKEVELAKAKIETLTSEAQKAAEKNNASKSDEIVSLKTTIKKLEEDLSNVTKAKSRSDDELSKLKADLEKEKSSAAIAAKTAEKEKDESQDSQNKLKEVNFKLVKEIAELKKQSQEHEKSLASAKNEKFPSNDAESEKTVQALKIDLEEKQGALDELLLLLDDLTEKKTSYKNRLREMKQDVSDSEAEGDDDDEED